MAAGSLPAVPGDPLSAEIHETAEVGDGTVLGAGAVLGAGVRVGRDATIGPGAVLAAGCVIGQLVVIGSHAELQGALLEDEVLVGPHACLLDDPSPRAAETDGSRRVLGEGSAPPPLPAVVRRGATVGAAAVVMPGVVVGHHAVVAPGGVVPRDVPPHALVAGNPARQVGWCCRCGRRLPDSLTCECGLAYRELGTRLEERPAVGPGA